MAVLDDTFPARKRRPALRAFASPQFSNPKLLQKLLQLCKDISSLQPLGVLLKKSSASIIRKSRLISLLVEELVRFPVNAFPPSAALCFEELYFVLHKIKALLEDCSTCSRMWVLMQIPSISSSFQQLMAELLTPLDIFPVKEMKLSEDVEELFDLIKKQCSAKYAASRTDAQDANLRIDVVKMVENIKREVIPDPSKLGEIFARLNLNDTASCRVEIENLQDEVQSQNDEISKVEIIALIGLVRYGKCVLYGASTPRASSRRQKSESDVDIPTDFRCPISLDLMRDPVVVSTGQTFDRSSISAWIRSGHTTCPTTSQALAHTHLIPNLALKNLIAMWCHSQRIPFATTETNTNPNGAVINKAALEATRMTASFLVNKLAASQTSPDAADSLVHELRVLAKTDSDSRICIAEAGALPLLVKFLGSDHCSLQINAITTILNLSILDSNKARILETDGALDGMIQVLRLGATWEAKGNAAATIFSLMGGAGRRRLGRRLRATARALLDLARVGPAGPRRDAMMAILSLAGDREGAGRLVEAGAVEVAAEVMEALPEEAAAMLELVVKRGGMGAVAAAQHMVGRLVVLLRDGSGQVRESAAATLVTLCRKGGSEVVAEMAAVAGIERVVREVIGMGEGRARRKAAELMRILRRWVAELVEQNFDLQHSVTSTTTRIVLPA